MRPLFLGLAIDLIPSETGIRKNFEPGISPLSADKHTTDPITSGSASIKRQMVHASRPDTKRPTPGYSDEDNQFERAVNYVGESSAVKMCLIIDEEGLILSQFSRCDEEADFWAPLVLVIEKNNRSLLGQYGRGEEVDKIDICTRNLRVIQCRIEHLILMVLTEREIDETIHIRVSQAMEMTRKYMSERYSPALFARVEERYVSNS
jgi:hypothetical protein